MTDRIEVVRDFGDRLSEALAEIRTTLGKESMQAYRSAYRSAYREARKEGRVEGRKGLLVQQSRQQFGRDCASSLRELFVNEYSLAELGRIGRWLLKSDSAEDFLAHAREI